MVSAVTDRSMIPMCSFFWKNRITTRFWMRRCSASAAISTIFPVFFSINCVFRYLLFSQEHHMEDYLKTMSTLGDHAGLIGFGEHYNQQFVNQTMTCVVFE